MTPQQLRTAQRKLRLSNTQMARMLETDVSTWKRMINRSTAKRHRAPAVRMIRLIKAYLDGYRPEDWPGPDTIPAVVLSASEIFDKIIRRFDAIRGEGDTAEVRSFVDTLRFDLDPELRAAEEWIKENRR